MAIYGLASGVNKEFKQHYGLVGGANKEFQSIYGLGGGVNKQVYTNSITTVVAQDVALRENNYSAKTITIAVAQSNVKSLSISCNLGFDGTWYMGVGNTWQVMTYLSTDINSNIVSSEFSHERTEHADNYPYRGYNHYQIYSTSGTRIGYNYIRGEFDSLFKITFNFDTATVTYSGSGLPTESKTFTEMGITNTRYVNQITIPQPYRYGSSPITLGFYTITVVSTP